MTCGVERPLAPLNNDEPRKAFSRCGGPLMRSTLLTGEPMKNPRYSRSSLVILTSAVLATLFQVACTQSQTQTAPATPQTKAAVSATKDVYVVFEGPWIIAPDPKDANSVLLLAPKTKTHRDLYVTASNHSTLSAGIYDLSFPGHVGP